MKHLPPPEFVLLVYSLFLSVSLRVWVWCTDVQLYWLFVFFLSKWVIWKHSYFTSLLPQIVVRPFSLPLFGCGHIIKNGLTRYLNSALTLTWWEHANKLVLKIFWFVHRFKVWLLYIFFIFFLPLKSCYMNTC